MIKIKAEYPGVLHEGYQSLLDSTTTYSIQQNQNVLSEYLNSFQRKNNFLSLAAFNVQNDLISFFYLEIKKNSFYKLFTHRQIFDLGHGFNDFYSIPCKSGYESEVAQAYCQWFTDNTGMWESIHLSFIPSAEGFEKILIHEFSKTFNVKMNNDRSFYKINTSGSWNDYFTPEINKRLRDVRGRKNRIKKAGYELRVEYVKENIIDIWDQFMFHFSKRREGKGESNSYDNKSKADLIKSLMSNNDHHGLLQMALLKDESNNIWAYQLDIIDEKKGVWFHYAPTFDEKYKDFSPGKVLLFESIQEAFRRKKIVEFNFMRGESNYKKQYTDRSQAYWDIKLENHNSPKVKFQRLMAIVFSK